MGDGEVKFVFKEKARAPVPAKIVGRELERIRQEHGGRLRPEHVIEEAQDENHPLHPCFEWDDSEAARLYRLEQASYLIRSVDVILIKPDNTELRIGKFVSLEGGADETHSRGYTDITFAMSKAELREEMAIIGKGGL